MPGARLEYARLRMRMVRPRSRFFVSAAMALASLFLATCQKAAAIAVTVQVDPGVRASCIRIAASSTTGEEVLSKPALRKDTVTAAVYRSAKLAGTITLVAQGYLGDGCDEPLVLNEESARAKITFPEGDYDVVLLTLKPLPYELDQDQDGFRAADKGGSDCNDQDVDTYPDAPEVCDDNRDNDCDSVLDCEEEECVGEPCNDGQKCTLDETCTLDGHCSGTPMPCNQPPAHGCSGPGVCDPDAGTCFYPTLTAGSACDDKNLCTLQDHCTAQPLCVGTAVVCNAPPPGPCVQPLGTCNGTTGNCDYGLKSTCDDGDLCTVSDLCSDAGVCAGTPKSCDTPPQCYALPGQCNLADGGCEYVATSGGPCNDGDLCTLADVCATPGACSGTPYTCGAPPNDCFVANCLGDGGCDFPLDVAKRWLPCDGGSCRPDGGCEPPSFPYLPMNFSVASIPVASIAPPISLGCNAVFDSSPGVANPFPSWCGQPTLTVQPLVQVGAPDAVLLATYGLTIPAGGSLTLLGSRPVVFAVFGDATFGGAVFANATFVVPGPGGSSSGCSTREGIGGGAPGGTNGGGGGGGGGYATNGGAGAAGANGSGGAGGAGGAAGGLVTLSPLLAGCGGGAGGANLTSDQGLSGAGGGALQVSVAGVLTVSSTVTASGGGGGGAGGNNAGGGGGGSGGAILLEADRLTLTSQAKLTANGGGGGEGAAAGTGARDGANGSTTISIPAAGGSGGSSQGSDGAAGGAGVTPPQSAVSSSRGGGGGGGSVGRIRLIANTSCSHAGALISPPHSNQNCP